MNTQRVLLSYVAFAIIASFAWTSSVIAASINQPLNGQVANNTQVVSPYWQSDSAVYTFVAVTHPSLSGMNSAIGVTATAMLGTGSASSVFSTSTDFTVNAGETARIFIVGDSLTTTFNTTNIPGATIISGTDTGSAGYIRFDPIATNPQTTLTNGYPDITMLSYWGAIVFNGKNTGFAMEFIGDLNDSTTHPNQSSNRFPSGLN